MLVVGICVLCGMQAAVVVVTVDQEMPFFFLSFAGIPEVWFGPGSM
jgi:hypothetical protein